jgi:hypothetical protein
MGLNNQINLTEVVSAYLFANTPMYLYRHLRSNPSIKELAENTTLEVLVKEYGIRTSKEKRTAEEVAVAYALLVAVTFLGYSQASAAFRQFDLSRLDWGNDIRDIFVRETTPETEITVSAKPTIFQPEQQTLGSSTTIFSLPK